MHDAWACGRPIEFGDDSNEMVLDIALERTQEQRRCSASYIRKKMKKLNLEKVPSIHTIENLKKKMKFNVTKVAIHPTLNFAMMKERLVYAKNSLMLTGGPLL